jgi:hypothetical protein
LFSCSAIQRAALPFDCLDNGIITQRNCHLAREHSRPEKKSKDNEKLETSKRKAKNTKFAVYVDRGKAIFQRKYQQQTKLVTATVSSYKCVQVWQLRRAIFSVIYNISQPNFVVLLTLECSFMLLKRIVLFRDFAKFCHFLNRSMESEMSICS